MSPPVVYFAHPVAAADHAGVRHNLGAARDWLRLLMRELPDVSWCAPWLPYLDALDEREDRERGLRDAVAVAARCDGIVLVGRTVTAGMALEAAAVEAGGGWRADATGDHVAVELVTRLVTAARTRTLTEALAPKLVAEFYDDPDWWQFRVSVRHNWRARTTAALAPRVEARWRHVRARGWSAWGQPFDWKRHPGAKVRMVPAATADLDPAMRGPMRGLK